MAVKFIDTHGRIEDGHPKYNELYGERFPSEEVQAYWSMVPETVIVEFSRAFGVFFVEKYPRAVTLYSDEEMGQPVKRLQIMASDGHKLAVWMKVISELCDDKPIA